MKRKARTARQQVQYDEQWDAECNPAVAELLDHVARELAEEYVRLMKESKDNPVGPATPAGKEANKETEK